MEFGISFSTVCKGSLELLKSLDINGTIIEIPCNDFDEMEEIINYCSSLGIKYGVHYPSYYSVGQHGFDLRDDSSRWNVYTDFVKYVEHFKTCEYFLFHFPGRELYQDEMAEKRFIWKCFDEFIRCIGGHKERIVFENVSVNKFFARGKEYFDMLTNTGIGLCLDIGHAHLVDADNVYEFIDIAGEIIKVVHRYNTSNVKNNKEVYGKHYPASMQGEGWIDMDRVDELIFQLRNLKYVIDEAIYE